MPKSAYLSQCRIVVYPSFHRNFYLTQILPAPEIPSSLKQNKILVFKIQIDKKRGRGRVFFQST